METQSIVVLDFGAQYSQLIARRIREQNVFSVVLPCTASLDEIRSYSPLGIILSGGPCSVYDQDAPNTDRRVFDLGLPVLGICYGLQLMVHVLGGKVKAADKREYGHAEVEIKHDSHLFHGVPKKLSVWMSHGDEAVDLPVGFHLTASSPNAVAAIENRRQEDVLRPVPSRSPPHAIRHRHPAQFRSHNLRREANLDSAALHRCDHRRRANKQWAKAAPSAHSPEAWTPP